MSVRIKPLSDRVVILPDESQEKTQTGLILPPNTQEKPQRGKIVATGPGKENTPMQVKVGDHVLYSKYGGTEIEIPGDKKNYIIMRESEVYAIL